jgi:hypothetical protein
MIRRPGTKISNINMSDGISMKQNIELKSPFMEKMVNRNVKRNSINSPSKTSLIFFFIAASFRALHLLFYEKKYHRK